VLHGLERFSALVVGNGLGTDPATQAEIRHLVAHARVPTIVDADGLTALGRLPLDLVGSETILTPHDGEFERLTGSRPGADRIDAARRLSGSTGAVVLLKGPTTIVAEPGGQVLLSTSGDTRLASAGTGDVLAGVIAALCARGIAPFEAAAAGAFIHGRAGALGWRHGLVAGDLAPHLSAVLDALLPGLR